MGEKTENLLETIASKPYEECEPEWREALRLLRLKVPHIVAVQAILKQGRWRNRANPAAYIRKAAMWSAIRMGLVDVQCQTRPEVLVADLNFKDRDGRDISHDEKLDIAQANFEERSSPYDYDRDPYYLVAETLQGDQDLVDWERAAELAGLDGGERIVLEIQLMGLGREQALTLCHTDEDRKYLQAAWKRFIRHREALKETLRSGASHQSRRIKRVTTEKLLELVFIELAGGGLRISFREPVPE